MHAVRARLQPGSDPPVYLGPQDGKLWAASTHILHQSLPTLIVSANQLNHQKTIKREKKLWEAQQKADAEAAARAEAAGQQRRLQKFAATQSGLGGRRVGSSAGAGAGAGALDEARSGARSGSLTSKSAASKKRKHGEVSRDSSLAAAASAAAATAAAAGDDDTAALANKTALMSQLDRRRVDEQTYAEKK